MNSMTGCKPNLKWSDTTAEGSIGNLENFRKVDWITRADALVDWIHALEQEYMETLKEPHGSK